MSAVFEGSTTLDSKELMVEKGVVHGTEEMDLAPLSSAKVADSYIECKEEDLIRYPEEEEKVFIKEAIVKFNVKPKSARAYLISKKMIQVRSEFHGR